MAALTHGTARTQAASSYGDQIKTERDRRETHGLAFGAILAALMAPAGAAPPAHQGEESDAAAKTEAFGDVADGHGVAAKDKDAPPLAARGRFPAASDDHTYPQAAGDSLADERHSRTPSGSAYSPSEFDFAGAAAPSTESSANSLPGPEQRPASSELGETSPPSVSAIADSLGLIRQAFRAAPPSASPTAGAHRAQSGADPDARSIAAVPTESKTPAPAQRSVGAAVPGAAQLVREYRAVTASSAPQLAPVSPEERRQQPHPIESAAQPPQSGISSAKAGESAPESAAASSTPVARQDSEKIAVVHVEVSRTSNARAVVTERNNTVNAQMTASSERAATMLTASIPALRRTLESLGVAANELSATAHQNAGGGQNPRRDREEQPGKGGGDRETQIFVTREVN